MLQDSCRFCTRSLFFALLLRLLSSKAPAVLIRFTTPGCGRFRTVFELTHTRLAQAALVAQSPAHTMARTETGLIDMQWVNKIVN